MPEINVPLLRKTMEHIEAHPEHWYQGTWRCVIDPMRRSSVIEVQPQIECGTAMCFAGWACELTGEKWARPDGKGSHITLDNGDTTNAATRARNLLGLSYDQANVLFDGVNTLQDLQEIVAGLIAEAEG